MEAEVVVVALEGVKDKEVAAADSKIEDLPGTFKTLIIDFHRKLQLSMK